MWSPRNPLRRDERQTPPANGYSACWDVAHNRLSVVSAFFNGLQGLREAMENSYMLSLCSCACDVKPRDTSRHQLAAKRAYSDASCLQVVRRPKVRLHSTAAPRSADHGGDGSIQSSVHARCGQQRHRRRLQLGRCRVPPEVPEACNGSLLCRAASRQRLDTGRQRINCPPCLCSRGGCRCRSLTCRRRRAASIGRLLLAAGRQERRLLRNETCACRGFFGLSDLLANVACKCRQ